MSSSILSYIPFFINANLRKLLPADQLQLSETANSFDPAVPSVPHVPRVSASKESGRVAPLAVQRLGRTPSLSQTDKPQRSPFHVLSFVFLVPMFLTATGVPIQINTISPVIDVPGLSGDARSSSPDLHS